MKTDTKSIIVSLSNNKKVGNFSSPHDFTFEDGTVLPRVSDELSQKLKVTFIEDLDELTGDVTLTFELSDDVYQEMDFWKQEWKYGEVHVVFCCLPMITALHSAGYDVKNSPFRAIRMEDRIKKLLSINKQSL